MLTINEWVKLKGILKYISDEKSVRQKLKRRIFNIDVTNRLRDEKGRFLPNRESNLRSLIKEESPLESDESDKPIKLVKVKGSYGTYKIKERWFTNEEKVVLYVFAAITILVILL
ncbi:hypothetical protein [Bacillus sp. OTU530]|uniref:hypothetical protein n=1 Tax=Bacillus sp. OTU530 TaxID=3043862 RepID=UPI00313DCE91